MSRYTNHSLRFLIEEGLIQTDPAELAEDLAPEDWHALPAGEGSKGLRLSDWAAISMPWTTNEGFARWLLFRRSRKDAGKLAFSFVFAPEETSLAEMACAADLRWTIEGGYCHVDDVSTNIGNLASRHGHSDQAGRCRERFFAMRRGKACAAAIRRNSS